MVRDSVTKLGRPDKLTAALVNQLRSMIQSGELAPGSRLPPEKDLSELFGIGRSSVREALQVLEYAGMIEIRRGIGRFVAEDAGLLNNGFAWLKVVQVAPAMEIMEARRFLEVAAVQLAAQRATDQDLADLREAYKRVVENRDSPEGFFRTELELHRSLARASGNSVMADLGSLLIERVCGQWEQFVRTSPTVMAATISCFGQLLEALESGDGSAAGELLIQHLRTVSDALKQ